MFLHGAFFIYFNKYIFVYTKYAYYICINKIDTMVQEKIRTKRESLGLSRDKLAKLADITPQTIYRAETSGKITLQNYLKITETLEKYGRKSKNLTSNNIRTNNSSDSTHLSVSADQGENI